MLIFRYPFQKGAYMATRFLTHVFNRTGIFSMPSTSHPYLSSGSRVSNLGGARTNVPEESMDKKRARLLYQSTKRGILECDIVLG